jgi:rare lipoprotein A (peptidoglycan hydrolase)
VTDRGPYVAGRELDLTTEVAQSIGFPMSAGVAKVKVTML